MCVCDQDHAGSRLLPRNQVWMPLFAKCYKMTAAKYSWRLIHTHYLQAAVGVDLSNVSSAEPPLTCFVHKILLVHVLLLVVAEGDVGTANQNFSSGVRLVFAGVAAFKNPRNEPLQTSQKKTDSSMDDSESYLQPSPWDWLHSTAGEHLHGLCCCPQL